MKVHDSLELGLSGVVGAHGFAPLPLIRLGFRVGNLKAVSAAQDITRSPRTEKRRREKDRGRAGSDRTKPKLPEIGVRVVCCVNWWTHDNVHLTD